MSTLVTSNISDGTTSVGTGYVVNGSAKAWVNWNTITSHSVYKSLNVASITDLGVGGTEVNFTSAMDSNDYADILSSSDYMSATNNGNKAASSCRCFTYTSSFSGVDVSQASLSIHGDLA